MWEEVVYVCVVCACVRVLCVCACVSCLCGLVRQMDALEWSY